MSGSATVPPTRLLVLALGTICILLGTLVAVTQWNDRQRRLAGASTQAAALARVLDEQMVNLFRGTDQALLGIAEGLRREPAMAAHDPRFENSLRRRLDNLPAARALYAIGPDGYIIQDSDPTTPYQSLADRDYFQAHKDGSTRGLFVSEPLISRSTGEWFVALSRPLENLEGEFAGVVVAAIDIAYFETFYAELGLGADDVISLATRDAVLVARQPRSEGAIGKRLPGDGSSGLARALKRAPVGVFEGKGAIDGTWRLVAYRALPEQPLVVLVGLSNEGILAPW